MQRKTKSVIACGMAAALMLTTLGMENEVSAKAAPKMQTKVENNQKGNYINEKEKEQSYCCGKENRNGSCCS